MRQPARGQAPEGPVAAFRRAGRAGRSPLAGRRVQRLIGATAHTLLDQAQNRADAGELDNSLSPGDVAVLVRLKAQIPPLRAALEQMGIPCAAPAQEEFWQEPVCARFLALAAGHCGFADILSTPPDLPAPAAPAEPLPWPEGNLPKPQEMTTWLGAPGLDRGALLPEPPVAVALPPLAGMRRLAAPFPAPGMAA